MMHELHRGIIRALAAAVAVTMLGTAAFGQEWATVGSDRLAAPGDGDWLNTRRTFDGHGHSPLAQINADNVASLTTAWAYSFRDTTRWAPNPVVANGLMYVSESTGRVHALDAVTGEVAWIHTRPLPDDVNVSQAFNRARGVAIVGDTVIWGTADSYLVALDAVTGEVIWETQTGDYTLGGGHSHPPIIADDIIVIGRNGGEFSTRGYVDAYAAEDGAHLWRFYTTPAEGDPEAATWPDGMEMWGGAPWHTPTYDPELGLVYIATGQPLPWSCLLRSYDDHLYTNTILALDITTGERAWHFQTLPIDCWDLDSPFESMLVDIEVDGVDRQALIHHTKSGWSVVLDRATGELISAYEFAYQNLIDSWSDDGRPNYAEGAIPPMEALDSGEVFRACPHLHGARNIHHPSYSSSSGLVFIGVNQSCMDVEFISADYVPGRLWTGFRFSNLLAPDYDHVGEFIAIDPVSGEVQWTYIRDNGAPMSASSLSTDGNVVFGGTTDRVFFALNATTGEELWTIRLNGDVTGAPITYEVDGVQYIAIGAGGTVAASTSFAPLVGLSTTAGSGVMWTFRLPDAVVAAR